jgi:hypothetical protein
MNTLKSFVILFSVVGFSSFGQDKFTTYDNTYAKKTFDIQITTKDKDKNNFSLYIDLMSLDASHEIGGITVSNKQYPDFTSALNESKLKYQEWVKTAQDNNVKDLSKDMSIKCKTGAYFLYGNDWKFQFLVVPTFNFRILEIDGKVEYILLVRTGKLTASSNEYMKVDGFALVFKSADEIDAFINAVSLDAINTFINKPKAEDLFKN